MSYDLVVWEGPVPASDEAAGAEYERVMDRMEAAYEDAFGTRRLPRRPR